MPTCIYCRADGEIKFPREHVIPESFGTFRENLTLGCVCRECNQYFGKDLEVPFARESAESIVRYRHGLRDAESAERTRLLTARVNIPGPTFGAKVRLRPNANGDGIEVRYLPQVAFKNSTAEEWSWYTVDDLNADLIGRLEFGSTLLYFFTSPDEEALLRSRLKELGLPPTRFLRSDVFQSNHEVDTRVTSIFNFAMARCVGKIAFNYLAYVLRENRLLLREDFDPIRNFVRHGSNSEQPTVRFSRKPILDERHQRRTLVDGHILELVWESDEKITCGLSLFNAMTYHVVICSRYRGLWFPLKRAHSFDFRTDKAMELPASVFVSSA